jgi:hypothetical protein
MCAGLDDLEIGYIASSCQVFERERERERESESE